MCDHGGRWVLGWSLPLAHGQMSSVGSALGISFCFSSCIGSMDSESVVPLPGMWRMLREIEGSREGTEV